MQPHFLSMDSGWQEYLMYENMKISKVVAKFDVPSCSCALFQTRLTMGFSFVQVLQLMPRDAPIHVPTDLCSSGVTLDCCIISLPASSGSSIVGDG